MKKFPIEIDIYKSFVHVNIGTKEEILKETERKGHSCPSYEGTLAHVRYQEGEDPILYLKKGFSPSTVVHEAVHCANAILRNIGIRPCYESEEAQSYLIEYIFDQIMKNK